MSQNEPYPSAPLPSSNADFPPPYTAAAPPPAGFNLPKPFPESYQNQPVGGYGAPQPGTYPPNQYGYPPQGAPPGPGYQVQHGFPPQPPPPGTYGGQPYGAQPMPPAPYGSGYQQPGAGYPGTGQSVVYVQEHPHDQRRQGNDDLKDCCLCALCMALCCFCCTDGFD